MRQTLLEARVGSGDALLGVAVNCAPALIGDDVRGICTAFAPGVPVAVAEGGGFTGDFDDGYGKAFLAVLEALRPGPCPPTPETVNLIGFSPLEEHAAENLAEIKRQLFRRGIEVHLTFGVPGTTVESIRKAGRAALNVVLHEGRGQGIAAWLQEHLGQPSIFAPLSDAANKKSGQLDAIEAALRMEKRR
ncbi:MAG: nitrogenase component 1 [Negativicutes bacterium]